jgi:type IV pilus assembly protein PilM
MTLMGKTETSKGKKRRLRAAYEFSAGNVAAARSADGYLIDVSAARALPAGAITPNLGAANVLNREPVLAAVRDVMSVLDSRTREVAAILPDAACRVVLLDLDVLPEKKEDADAVIRFRLKKSLPFDVERTHFSWQAQKVNDKLTVLAAVVMNTVLEEYESVLREAGLMPGIVLPSILAALGQVDASVPTLVIKVDSLTTSIAIADHDALLLVRTLDHAAGWQPDAAQLADDVYPSLVFFQDAYGTKVEKILVSGLDSLEELNAALAENTGLRAQELVTAARLGAGAATERTLLGGVAGALA